jgi:hypothetical protein
MKKEKKKYFLHIGCEFAEKIANMCLALSKFGIIKNRLHAMRHRAESVFVVESNFSAKSNPYSTSLAHEAEHPGVTFNEKTEGQKSRYTVPLILTFYR